MLEFLAGVFGFAMSTVMMVVLFIIQLIFLMFIGGLAKSKNRSVLAWVIIGAISPFITFIALHLLTRKYPKTGNDFRHTPELASYNPLVVAVVGVFGYISSADGRVDENEYNSVYLHLKKSYGMSKRDLAGYREIIDYTKAHPEMVEQYTAVINKYTKPENKFYENARLMAILCNVIALNDVEASEIVALRNVMMALGVNIEDMTPFADEMMNQGATREDVEDLVEVL